MKMGITGLLPFLEKSSCKTNINEFSGRTVAIDAYCWLHKGVFSCAEKLLMEQTTDAYVHYCMKFVNMLLKLQIKPILVFDGRHLPAKATTEAKRRESRSNNRRRAAELIRAGQISEGKSLLKRAVDVTHKMALEVIKHCQRLNIDCIVAPYEADAQLAYLNINGIADVVITEDSDLTLFGCKKVFFKMDQNGYGLLIVQEKLHLAMGIHADHFDYEKFRYMCILSGCDYLPSLPGIGLNKAKKFVDMNTDSDIYKALTRVGSYLNMKSLVVTDEYRDSFLKALITFKHQLVFCPIQRKQVRLTPPTPDVTEDQLNYAGKELNTNLALQLALGNCDPFTFEEVHDFNPDRLKSKNNGTILLPRNPLSKRNSIWSLYNERQEFLSNLPVTTSMYDTAEQNNTLKIISDSSTRVSKVQNNVQLINKPEAESDEFSSENMLKIYRCNDAHGAERFSVENVVNTDEKHSPCAVNCVSGLALTGINQEKNPFTVQSRKPISPNLLLKGRSRSRIKNLLRIKKTIFDEDNVIESRFFTKLAETNIKEPMRIQKVEDTDSNNINVISDVEQENSHFQQNTEMKEIARTCGTKADKKNYSAQPNGLFLKAAQQLPNIMANRSKCIHPLQDKMTEYLHDSNEVKNTISSTKKSCVNDVDDKRQAAYFNTRHNVMIKNENMGNLQNISVACESAELFQNLNEPKINYKKRSLSIVGAENKIFKRNRNVTKGTDDGSQQSLLSMYGFQKRSTLKH